MILIPYEADVTMYRWPVTNFVLIGAITLVSIVAFGAPVGSGMGVMVLDGWPPAGILGHVFLHGGVLLALNPVTTMGLRPKLPTTELCIHHEGHGEHEEMKGA